MSETTQALQPFEQAQGRTLTAVLCSDSDEGEEIILAFASDGLTFACGAETDALMLSWGGIGELEEAEDLTADPAWSRLIGKELSSGWLTLNQRGHVDGALLSFDGVVPEIGLNVVAGAFEILDIRQRAR